MKIYLGTDHAGFELKEQIKAFLKASGYMVEDEGAYTFDPEDDYTDYVKIVAKLVQSDPESRGLVLGGSGQGEAIVANRFAGVRATIYYGGPLEIIKLSREHNDANILSLGARFLNFEQVKEVLNIWLSTQFSGEERHLRRINDIDNNESLGKVI